MLESVSCFIKGCSLCAVSKPSNSKLGLYTPLLVPSRPWESISMDFVGIREILRSKISLLRKMYNQNKIYNNQ